MKKLFSKVFTLVIIGVLLMRVTPDKIKFHKNKFNKDSLVTIPIGGNTWSNSTDTIGGKVTNEGIEDWTNKKISFTTHVRFGTKGNLKIWLKLKAIVGQSKLQLTLHNVKKTIVVDAGNEKAYYVGEWFISDTGYCAIKITAISNTGKVIANIKGLALSGLAADSKMAFVKNNDGDFFYWGRRGPSVHLNYPIDDTAKAAWFYNEVTVPKNNDVIGSYFMACGFAEGYFGIQVNSITERRVLFSVWSPFKTDNPNQIPNSQKIVMLKKGPDVHTGEFGNEGSGGQSYLQFNWIAGNTYKFLIHAQPDSTNHTTYTAYFFAPEINKWQLIASFKRPQTTTYLKHLHSFLENFEPEMGAQTREVYFSNQWIADENGNWTELDKARFTIDNTGLRGYRMDYSGGTSNNSFFLRNCGFFNNYTSRNSIFNRIKSANKPDINFTQLP